MRNSHEEDLQIAIMDMARLHAGWNSDLLTLIHIPNGGFRTAREAGRLKMAGVRSGVSDLYLPPDHDRPGLWIELKHGKNTPTRDQEDWMKKMADRGQMTSVVRCLEGAAAVIAWHTGDNRLMKGFKLMNFMRAEVVSFSGCVPRRRYHSSLCNNALEIPCKSSNDFDRFIAEICD